MRLEAEYALSQGEKGNDGISPTIIVNEDTSLTITDKDGKRTTEPLKGKPGDPGKDAAIISSTEPSDKTTLWCDISQTPPLIKQYNGTEWIVINDQTDAINLIYKNINESVSEASENVMIKIGENFYDKENVDTILGNISTQFQQSKDSFDFKFSQLLADLNGLASGTDERFIEVNKYIRFVNGVVLIGIDGNPLTLKLQNDKISFMENESEVAYISNRKMYITDAEITGSLTIGNFAFVPRNNGNLSFKKVR